MCLAVFYIFYFYLSLRTFLSIQSNFQKKSRTLINAKQKRYFSNNSVFLLV